MKKIIYSCLVAIFTVGIFASCDENASENKLETAADAYISKFYVSLYSPSYKIENDPLCKDSMLCSTSITDTVAFFLSNKDGLQLYVQGLEELHFEMPFLDDAGEVRSIFKNGTFAKLYNRMKQADADGLMDHDVFLQFREDIKVIKDTLSIGTILTSPMPYDVYGASMITWDFEQNSNYVRFNSEDLVPFVRRNNIFSALMKMQDVLTAWANAGKFTAEELKELEEIEEQQEGETSAWGWGTVKYANYHLNFDLHVEPEYTRGDAAISGGNVGDGMLDKLSIALFGKDEKTGLPNHPVWLVIQFDGNALSEGDWKIAD